MHKNNNFSKASSSVPLPQNSESEQPSAEPLNLQKITPLPLNSSSKSTPPAHSNRTLQILISMTTIIFGMAAVSGVTYVIASFVMTQLEAQQTLKDRQGSDPYQQKLDQKQKQNLDIDIVQQEQNTVDASTRAQFNRAVKLAETNQFQAAIVEASSIPSSSLFYQQSQRFISQWSEQKLQQEAEQRATQQRLQAEREDNQGHLQLAQQALTENDWATALQEARQISSNPLWQQQKNAIIQRAEPYEYQQRAKRFLDQGEPENAMNEANKLPSISPWVEKKAMIIDQARQRFVDKRVAKKWNDRCREWAGDNISRCPNVEDVKAIEEILPTSWVSKLLPASRKSKR